jgi:hypothetical protein
MQPTPGQDGQRQQQAGGEQQPAQPVPAQAQWQAEDLKAG